MTGPSLAKLPLRAAQNPLILLADDSSEDRKMIQMGLIHLAAACAVKTVPDGAALIRTLRGQGGPLESGERPDLILLDLNMPVMGGLEALHAIKADPLLKAIPIVVWTTSENPLDLQQAYQSGANFFCTKPDSFDDVVEALRVLTHYWLR